MAQSHGSIDARSVDVDSRVTEKREQNCASSSSVLEAGVFVCQGKVGELSEGGQEGASRGSWFLVDERPENEPVVIVDWRAAWAVSSSII